MGIYIFKYVNAVVQAYVYADVGKPERLMSKVLFTGSLPCFLRHGLSLNPELTNFTRLVIQQALPLHSVDHRCVSTAPSFYMRFWDPKSSAPAYTARLHEQSHLPRPQKCFEVTITE